MKNRLPKRLSAWLLTLIMLVGMLPAMASADEVDEDLSPPAPQEENYGYVRLVFSEGEQLDLYHGEYITECSPTAAVHDGADEDFLTDGDYLALYYEGKLYCKAALDGVSIDADAVLPAEDFALVPMGEAPTTLGEEHEDKTPPAVEVVDPEDESSGSDETVGTPPLPESEPPDLPESKEEDKTTEGEGGSSGSDYGIGDDTQPRGPMRVPVMPTATGESGYIGVVNCDDNKIFFERMYDNSYLESMLDVGSDGKFDFEKHTGSGAPSQYVLWYTGGVLHMKNYNGGGISTGNSKHLTILVEADSTITGDDQGCIDLEGSLGQYHNVTISSDNDSKLTLNMNGSYGTAAAINSDGGNRTESTVTIEGSVKVEANVYNSSSSNGAMAFGIEARDVIIRNSASFKAVCSTEAQKNSDIGCYGIVANGTLTVNTTGTIDIDVSHASADDRAYSVGLRGESVDLQQVKYMKIKWAKGYLGKYGAAIYPKRTAINNHAVGYPDDTTAIYRSGPPHKVVLTDCSITSAKDRSGKTLYTKGTFLLGDRLTVEADNHGIGVVGWYTNPDSFPDSPAASGSTLVYQVPAASTDIRIKPLYRLGETGGLSFEWTGADTGRVRLKLRESYGIDPNEIKLLDRTGNEVASGATYDNTSGMLSMEVGNIQPNATYRIKTSHTKAKVDLYSDWFKAISVPPPTIDKPSGCYYGSMNVNVTAPSGTEGFYKTGSAEIYSGSEGTAFSVDPIAVNGTNNSVTLRTRKITNGVAIWSTPVTATWTKLDTLPVPEVTFYNGTTPVTPDASNTVLFHERLTVVLSKPSPWPVNAEMHYSTGGVSNYLYKKAFEYTKTGYLGVWAEAALSSGGTQSGNQVAYTIKQHPNSVTSELRVKKDIEVFDIDGNKIPPTGTLSASGQNKYTLYAGTQITVQAPSNSGAKVFRYWTVSTGPSVNFDNKNSPRATFIMPDKDIQLAAYYDTPTDISEPTRIKFTPGNPAGMNMALQTNYDAWRSLSYKWYEGDTASGTLLNSFASFEIGKTYTAHVKVTATEGIRFTDSATIRVQRSGSNLEVDNSRVERATNGRYLAFDLHLITKPELTIEPVSGDTLPTAEALTAQLPEGYTVTPTWGATTAPSGATEVTITKLEIRPADGSYQLANSSVWINGTERLGEYSSGTLTLTNITVPVKSKGVKVSGTIKSYNPGNATTIQLMRGGTKMYQTTIVKTTGSGQVPQSFSFPAVAAGTYDLVVTKPGHLTYTIKNVVVGDTPLNLTTHSNAAISTITLLAGDVNGDEKINSTDTTFIRYPSNFNKSVSLPGVDAIADINGDGKINSTDTTIVRYPENFNKNAGKHCTVQY